MSDQETEGLDDLLDALIEAAFLLGPRKDGSEQRYEDVVAEIRARIIDRYDRLRAALRDGAERGGGT